MFGCLFGERGFFWAGVLAVGAPLAVLLPSLEDEGEAVGPAGAVAFLLRISGGFPCLPLPLPLPFPLTLPCGPICVLAALAVDDLPLVLAAVEVAAAPAGGAALPLPLALLLPWPWPFCCPLACAGSV